MEDLKKLLAQLNVNCPGGETRSPENVALLQEADHAARMVGRIVYYGCNDRWYAGGFGLPVVS